MADLGSWLSGGYRISNPASEEDLDHGNADDPNHDDDGTSSGPPRAN
jgi:hypothetical protein